MADFVLLYRGGSTPESDEEQAAVMAAWTTWFGSLGSAVKDGGNPFTEVARRRSQRRGDRRCAGDRYRDRLLDPAGGLSGRGGDAREGVPGTAERRGDRGLRDLPGDVRRSRTGGFDSFPSCYRLSRFSTLVA